MAACLTPSCFHNVFLLYKKVFSRLLTPTYDKLTSTHAPKNSTVEVHHLYPSLLLDIFLQMPFPNGSMRDGKVVNLFGTSDQKKQF
jgi:hypothetical protein